MTVGVTVSPLTLLIGPTKRDRDFPDHPADPATTTSHLPPRSVSARSSATVSVTVGDPVGERGLT